MTTAPVPAATAITVILPPSSEPFAAAAVSVAEGDFEGFRLTSTPGTGTFVDGVAEGEVTEGDLEGDDIEGFEDGVVVKGEGEGTYEGMLVSGLSEG